MVQTLYNTERDEQYSFVRQYIDGMPAAGTEPTLVLFCSVLAAFTVAM
jgi:hypothetical protein